MSDLKVTVGNVPIVEFINHVKRKRDKQKKRKGKDPRVRFNQRNGGNNPKEPCQDISFKRVTVILVGRVN